MCFELLFFIDLCFCCECNGVCLKLYVIYIDNMYLLDFCSLYCDVFNIWFYKMI